MVTTLLAVLSCIALAYYLLSLYAAWRLFRPSPVGPAACPAVSILKPLKGATPDLYEHLASFCRIEYPVFQLLFGVRDPRDPAIAVVRRLQRAFPECDIGLVVNPEVIGSNYKVSTLHALSQRATYDIFVVSDSDVRVAPDYLRRIIPSLDGSQVGVVTCPYRSATRQPLPALLESVLINTAFMPSVVLASQVQKTAYAFGATMAVTRRASRRSAALRPWPTIWPTITIWETLPSEPATRCASCPMWSKPIPMWTACADCSTISCAGRAPNACAGRSAIRVWW